MRLSRGAALAAAVVLLASACSHSRPAATTPSHSPMTPSPTPSTSAKPRPKPKPTNPFTGLRYSNHPVVAVKIDDTSWGRPQLGIDKADLVYVTQVEGGLTRLLAVYNTTLPKVEPVRSTRADNPELALEFGHIIYVASGGSPPELKPLYHSPLRADINDRGGPGFARDPSRPAPYNLRANLAIVAAKIHGPKAHSIGLVWSRRITARKSSPGTVVRTTVGATPVVFRWSAKLHRYIRVIDGVMQHAADKHLITTPNVIVQFCKSNVYWKDKDVLHNPAQYTHTIGKGTVVVFRDGRRITGTWVRRSVNAGTQLLGSDGKPIALAPGGAWFVLTKNGTRLY